MFSITWLAYAGLYLCRKNFSVLIPLLIVQAGLSRAELANAVFVYSVAYCAGQFTNGGLADRFGARCIVTIGLLASIVSTAAMGLWHTAAGLAALQAVNGFAQSSGWPGLVKLMGVWFPRAEQRGIIMGWWSTNYVVGGFVATLLATWAVTTPWLTPLGWRVVLLFRRWRCCLWRSSLRCSRESAMMPTRAVMPGAVFRWH